MLYTVIPKKTEDDRSGPVSMPHCQMFGGVQTGGMTGFVHPETVTDASSAPPFLKRDLLLCRVQGFGTLVERSIRRVHVTGGVCFLGVIAWG
jgi:hypothetical protein